MLQYLDLLEKIRTTGEERGDRTGTGTLSLFGEQLSFDLSEGFPLLTTKKVFFRGVMVELLWFLRGRTDSKWLSDRGVTIWDEWATAEQCARFGRSEGDLGPIYGHQWRNYGDDYHSSSDARLPVLPVKGVDQLRDLVAGLRDDPQSRRHIVTGWNPKEADQVALPPCHTLFQCYVHTDGRLDLHLYQRSADFFLGVPFNIASYALLVHILCHTVWQTNLPHTNVYGAKTTLRPGRLVISFGDVHLYSNHIDQADEQLSRTPNKRLPILKIHAPRQTPLSKFEERDFELLGYSHQGMISAPVAI